jgi:hypothetical protein
VKKAKAKYRLTQQSIWVATKRGCTTGYGATPEKAYADAVERHNKQQATTQALIKLSNVPQGLLRRAIEAELFAEYMFAEYYKRPSYSHMKNEDYLSTIGHAGYAAFLRELQAAREEAVMKLERFMNARKRGVPPPFKSNLYEKTFSRLLEDIKLLLAKTP